MKRKMMFLLGRLEKKVMIKSLKSSLMVKDEPYLVLIDLHMVIQGDIIDP